MKATADQIPTCPWCGYHDRATTVHHPDGKYLCSCGSLFDGTDSEWRRLAQHRRESIERRSRRVTTGEED